MSHDRTLPRDDDAQIRTFLIADVRGYTLFTNERGDEAAAKLAAKFAELAEETIAARGGSVIELRGDEALAVFSSARQAIRASLDLQARFVEETVADPSLPLPVGIGLDAGEAVPVAGGYRGGALNLAARLCGQAGPGEVLASAEVVHLARKIDGVTYIDRGTVALKGLEEPVRVIKVVPEGDDPADLLKPRTAAAPPSPSRSIWRRPVVIGAISIAVILAVVAVALPLLRNDHGAAPLIGDGLQMLNAADGSPNGSLPLQGSPGGVASGGGFIWVSDTQAGTILKVDSGTQVSIDTIEVGGDPTGVAFGDGSVWVVESNAGVVARVDPSTDRIVARIPVGNGPSAVAATTTAVWVTNFSDDNVTRIDPTTSKPVGTINVGDGPTAVAADDQGAWVVSINDGLLTHVQTGSGTTTSIRVGNGPAGVAIEAGSIWVSNGLDGTLSRIDPSTGTVTATPIGDGPAGVSAGDGSIWVANRYGGTIARVDPTTAQYRQIHVAGAPFASTVDGDVVWVGTLASPTVHRGGTLRVASEGPIDTIDPATSYDTTSWSILPMTNDGLVAYQRVGGPQGAAIVPDLATSIPQPSDGGKALTFHLRPGIRYSDGTLVRPEDFRRALERTFAVAGPAGVYFGKIVGAQACLKIPASCDLSAGIEVDDAEEAITFHLTEPDSELLYALALPAAFAVPETTPLTAVGMTPIPATGPYMITSYNLGNHGSIRLERNPMFEEWSRPAKPDGYPDVIEWTFGMSPDDQVTAAEQNQLDYMVDTPPSARLRELRTRYPSRLFDQASPSTLGFSINVQLAPFDDVRARRALQFAVNRSRMVAGIGGTTLFALTCQTLPPDFPSHRPYCPYTRHPDARGSWIAPDLARARALVAASGTRGAAVTVWSGGLANPAAREVTRALTELGYRATLKVVAVSGAYFGHLYSHSSSIQIGFLGWGQDFPAPSSFMIPLFSCTTIPPDGGGFNVSHFCDRRIERQMRQALAIQGDDPAAASDAWAEVDHAIVDASPFLAFANPRNVYFVSDRVGNVQINPQWNLLLDQLWVR